MAERAAGTGERWTCPAWRVDHLPFDPPTPVTLTFAVTVDAGLPAGTRIANTAWAGSDAGYAPVSTSVTTTIAALGRVYLPLVLR
jgi:hypothetical protein